VVAFLTGMASSGCMASSRSDDITSLQIVRLEVPADARGEPRRWRAIETKSRAASLADALGRCETRDLVKFKPKYRVVATRTNGSETTFLVLGEYVKIDGLAFRCPQNIQDLVERLWTEDPAAPH
jgi:hypothetical protein